MPFHPIALGALYPGIERGLSADILAARALGGTAYPVCTSLIIAGDGVVTDLLEVPSDTVSAQLEHVFNVNTPNAARVGILGSPATVDIAFRHLGQHLSGPIVLDLTLSGPSGEDLADGSVRELLAERLPLPDLVTLRAQDAQLLVGMEIDTLDDAQVAVQRLHKRGARRILLRCGVMSQEFASPEDGPPFHNDLYYDGDEFALFEAPPMDRPGVSGASSALSMAILYAITEGSDVPAAVQQGKAYVSESLHRAPGGTDARAPGYFEAASHLFAPSSR
jgi:hydroxymethylpyrimidine kinase/phosphomethylpyrimidine kinase